MPAKFTTSFAARLNGKSQVTVVESYAGFGEEKYFNCPVTEIVGAANSVVDHYRMGQGPSRSEHLRLGP